MAKMMTYGEANVVLDSSLSPSNRCLSKSVAINNGANPNPLLSFADSRLVSASVIERNGFTVTFIDYDGVELQTGLYESGETITPPTTPSHAGLEFKGWFSTIDKTPLVTQAYRNDTYKAIFAPNIYHYFIDSNGNNIGTEIYLKVPQNSEWAYFETKTMLGDQPIPQEFLGKWEADGFVSGGKIDFLAKNRHYSKQSEPEESMVHYVTGGYPTPYMFSNGVTKHPVYLYNPDRYGPGWQYCGLEINDDTANMYNLNDYIDEYNIIYHAEIDPSKTFYLSEGTVSLNNIAVGDSVAVDIFGSNDVTIEYILFRPEGSILITPRFSEITKTGNTLFVTRTRTGDTGQSNYGWFDFYKITDVNSGEVIYFGVIDKKGIDWKE